MCIIIYILYILHIDGEISTYIDKYISRLRIRLRVGTIK